MADWPRQGGGQRYTDGTKEGLFGTEVICTSANTKGVWKEFFSALPFDAQGFIFNVTHNSTGVNSLTDIGIGGSGSEVVLVPNIHYGFPRIFQAGHAFFVPISAPKGSRITCRTQGNGAFSLYIQLIAIAGGFDQPALGVAEAYGANTGTSGGTLIDGGAVANTKSAWVELTAATGFRIRQLLFFYNGRGQALASANYVFDIAVGASSSEMVIIPDLVAQANVTSDEVGQKVVGPLPVDIPKGTRIAIRMSSETTNSVQRILQATVIGVG